MDDELVGVAPLAPQEEEGLTVVPEIVYPKGGYAQNRQIMARPTAGGTPWEQDVRRLKRRYKVCTVDENDEDGISLTLLHVPTDPEFQTEWLEGLEGLLFCFTIPVSYTAANPSIETAKDVPHLDIVSPCSPTTDLVCERLNEAFVNTILGQAKANASVGIYYALQNLDRYHFTKCFLEVAREIYENRLANRENSEEGVVEEKKKEEEVNPLDIAGEEDWDSDEQNDLEEALEKAERLEFPDVKRKWRWIAGKVATKSAKQCAARFNECRAKAMAQAAQTDGGEDESASAAAQPALSLANETTVNNMGVKMDASGIDLKGVSDVLLSRLELQLRCTRCKKVNDHHTGTLKAAGVTSSRFQCDICKLQGIVHIVPSAMTPATPAFGKILVESATIRDINVIDCQITCENCTKPQILTKVIRGAKKLSRCRECHQNQHVKVESFFLGASATGESGIKGARKRDDGQKHVFKVGNPLPDQGRCKHYRKSNRWLKKKITIL